MNKILSYPKCAQSFFEFYSQDMKLLNKYMNKLIYVNHFDVTLRDGIQGLSKEQQLTMKVEDKINLYYSIKQKYQPINMEIGSIVSNKILPVFQDSAELYNNIRYNQLEPSIRQFNNYILIPNEKHFQNIDKFIGLNKFSFISSVSDSFQQKNTKMSLSKTHQEINNMIHEIYKLNKHNSIKLYISCINECPIEGKIDNDIVVNKILKHYELGVDIMCLSDTCGSLSENDLKYILSKLHSYLHIDDFNKLSLHLHVKPGRENEVEQIIHCAIDSGITNFDVSALNTGGCSVTINKSELAPNLSYELYYKSLATYLLKE